MAKPHYYNYNSNNTCFFSASLPPFPPTSLFTLLIPPFFLYPVAEADALPNMAKAVAVALPNMTSQCDMVEELSKQLEDILSTYCQEDSGEDGTALPNGQSHGPELNGLANEREAKVNGGSGGAEKEQKKMQEKKKVKGLGKARVYS